MKIITFFNHKGGVAKTTNAFNLSWKLAEKGHRVVMVDADSQCNLTGLAMGLMPPELSFTGVEEFSSEELESADDDFEETQEKAESFWRSVNGCNIHSALKPAFLAEPRPLEGVDCLSVEGNENLFLLPGSIDLADYESDLALSQSLMGQFGSQRNLPGAIHYLLARTAEKMDAEYLVVDLSPSLGAINQNIVSISDEIIIPCAPDYFSVMALQSLTEILPKWKKWAQDASEAPQLQQATYPFPKPEFKVSGVLVSRYVVYKKKPARAFGTWIDKVAESCESQLFPRLTQSGLVHEEGAYASLNLEKDYVLAMIREFNSLRPRSQDNQIPVFALKKEHLQLGGQSLNNTLDQIRELDAEYVNLADRVIALSATK